MRKRDEKKVQVEKELELLVKDNRQKRDDIVFLVADNVCGELVLEFLCGMCKDKQYIERFKIAIPGGRNGIVRDLSLCPLDKKPPLALELRLGWKK